MIHVVVDEGLKSIALAISSWNIYNSKMFNKLYDKIKSKRIYENSAYDTGEVRDRLEKDELRQHTRKPWRKQISYNEGYKVMRLAIERFNS